MPWFQTVSGFSGAPFRQGSLPPPFVFREFGWVFLNGRRTGGGVGRVERWYIYRPRTRRLHLIRRASPQNRPGTPAPPMPGALPARGPTDLRPPSSHDNALPAAAHCPGDGDRLE